MTNATMPLTKLWITSMLMCLKDINNAPLTNCELRPAEQLTDNCLWQAKWMILNIAIWGIPHNKLNCNFTWLNMGLITTFTSMQHWSQLSQRLIGG